MEIFTGMIHKTSFSVPQAEKKNCPAAGERSMMRPVKATARPPGMDIRAEPRVDRQVPRTPPLTRGCRCFSMSRRSPRGPERSAGPAQFARYRAGGSTEWPGNRSDVPAGRHLATDLLAFGEGQVRVGLHLAQHHSLGPCQDTGVALET